MFESCFGVQGLEGAWHGLGYGGEAKKFGHFEGLALEARDPRDGAE